MKSFRKWFGQGKDSHKVHENVNIQEKAQAATHHKTNIQRSCKTHTHTHTTIHTTSIIHVLARSIRDTYIKRRQEHHYGTVSSINLPLGKMLFCEDHGLAKTKQGRAAIESHP